MTFAQDPHIFVEQARYVWDVRGPEHDGGGQDVALITLEEVVPTDLVANIPKVNTGWISTVLSETNDFVTVGYGERWEGSGLDDKRRYGGQTDVKLALFPCGSASIIGFTCLLFPEIWSSRYSGALGFGGDSGGPLFALDAELDEYVVIGIRSGRRTWKSDPWKQKSVFAPIGWVGEDQGVHDVASRIGPDADGDGVPDHLDNCSPAFCEEHHLPLHRCVNPNQEDDDGDGIGEACDNCPQRICDQIGDGRSCQNVKQNDFDGDGLGDVCDNCPAIPDGLVGIVGRTAYNPGGKVVGDACNCPGDNTAAFLPCEPRSTFCEKAGAGTCLSDLDVQGNVVGGLCSMLIDKDGDGVPDKCDNCPTVWDDTTRNANLHIEREVQSRVANGAEKVPILGDVCDPVPVFPFDRGEIPPNDRNYVPLFGQGDLGMDIEKIEGYPWLGADPTRQSSFQQPFAFRHCSCYKNNGDLANTDECARLLCPPSKADPTTDGWKEVTVSRTMGGEPISDTGTPAQFSTYVPSTDPHDMAPHWPSPETFYWDIYADTMRLEDPVYRNGTRTHGVMASVVFHVGGEAASLRDNVDDALRTSLRMLTTPRVRYQPPDFVVGPCRSPHCLGVMLRPWEPIWNPHDMVSRFDRTEPIMFSDDGPATLQRDRFFVDASGRMSQTVVDLMVSKNWAWIPRSDRLALTFSVADEVGILIPRAETTGISPIRLVDVEGVIEAAAEAEYAPSLELLMGGVQIGHGERAVYSAQRGRLYLAGRDAGWRVFDASSGTLRPSGFDRHPVGALEGMTLDTLNNRIFTLEVEEISETASVARIVSYQLASGASQIHWTVPFTGMYERLALVADEGGALLLIASTTQDIVAWRYGVGNDGLEALGRFESTSRLLDEPHHASKMVPVMRKDGADLLDLDPAKFLQGAPCVSL